MVVEVRNYRPDDRGYPLGLIDARLPASGIEIFGIELCEDGDRKFLRLPHMDRVKANGYRERSYPMKFYIDEDYRAFCRAVFSELGKQLKKSGHNALRKLHNART